MKEVHLNMSNSQSERQCYQQITVNEMQVLRHLHNFNNCHQMHSDTQTCSIMQLQLDQCWRKEVVECSQTSQSHYNIKVHNTIGLIYYRKGFNDKHCTIKCAHIGVCSKL